MEDCRENKSSFEDEISLRELITKVQYYIHLLKERWIIITVVTVLGAIILGVYSYIQVPKYLASKTFMVNEDSGGGGGGGGIGGAASLLGQFGLGAGKGGINLDKIIALAKSKRIIGEALLDSSQQPLLANQLIETYKLHENWKESSMLAGYSFDNTNQDLIARNSALNACINLVRGDEKNPGIVSVKFDDETGILQLNASTLKPDLSILLIDAIYDKLSKFYIKEATERPKQNYRLLKDRADSVSTELAIIERQIAKQVDNSKNIMLRADDIKSSKLQRTAQVLTIIYAEVIKNRETALFILKSETPFFQVIDSTKPPISPRSAGVIKPAITGGALALVLAVSWIVLATIYKDIMSEGEQKL